MSEETHCPCGHELDPDDRNFCLIWDKEGIRHRLPRMGEFCECHGLAWWQIEAPRPADGVDQCWDQ